MGEFGEGRWKAFCQALDYDKFFSEGSLYFQKLKNVMTEGGLVGSKHFGGYCWHLSISTWLLLFGWLAAAAVTNSYVKLISKCQSGFFL